MSVSRITTKNPRTSVEKSEKPRLLCPKRTLSVRTWNVRTVKDDSQLHILNEELVRWNCDIVGISETDRRGTEELCLGEYKFIAQGVEEGPSRSGDGMFLSNSAQKALEGYSPVSDRIILAKFTTMVGCLVVIPIYAPTTEATNKKLTPYTTN